MSVKQLLRGLDRSVGNRLVPAILSMAFLAQTGALAQTEVSPLVGKTILVLNPQPGEPLNVDMSGTGYPMAAGAGNWMSFTVPPTLQFHITKFGVRNAYGQGNFWIGRTGLQVTGADSFTDADFAGKDTLWILIDPSGPASAPPALLTEAPKVVKVFNPWPTTAPILAFAGGTTKGMLVAPGNCGWFMAYLLKPAEQSFFLQEIHNADAYGRGGLGNRTPYDLAAEFAAKGSVLWLDTDINAWLAADPGKNRPCGYQMAVTVRDFSSSHVDFGFAALTGDKLAPGMVLASLGPDRKPVRSAKTDSLFQSFGDWFTTKEGVNAETCFDIPMTQSDDGMWQYDSYANPEHGFWPIENFNNPNNQKSLSCYVKPDGITWVSNQPQHNMYFCTEAHATFVYQRGQVFEFRGNDDIWVYINGNLVLDLGGIHVPKADSIQLDSLGLTPGRTYTWDFFHCHRQACGSSLKIKTSIYLKQMRRLEAEGDPEMPGTFRIVKRSGGAGSCASAGDSLLLLPVTPGSLTYKLWDAAGTEVEALGEGSFHDGGIVIATPNITVDTSKIRNLPGGNYRVVAYEAANPGVRAEIPFHAHGTVNVLVRPRQPKAPAAAVRAHDALGRAAPGGKPEGLGRFWRLFRR